MMQPYQLGSRVWPCLAKLLEETGEVSEIGGKIIGNGGRPIHYDGTNLIRRMGEEVADLSAATRVFIQLNGYDDGWVLAREQEKYHLFLKWHFDNLEDKPDEITEMDLGLLGRFWRRVGRFLGVGSDTHYQIYWAWRVYPQAMFHTAFLGVMLGALPGIGLWIFLR